ncbi:L-type lectin-domain containing receptor kinase I.8-like isoform X1 [Pistacia vera]|uniref:L-type lectin-domain containing receptor kinase I.8-like isoform X1 n=2 Tax=Pistacia vera TaxID=55513 RepID=UPI00126339CE|nr:L-type lectin-domain containing receptor kinase I.8-like isoform X1 [Pistacia vera]
MAAALRSVYVWMIFSLTFIFLCSSQNENEFIHNNGFHEANLQLDEISIIHPNGLLQLTNTSERQAGHAFYPFPFKFNTSSPESLSFSTNFVFAIVPESVNIGGHGIAFVISPSMDFSQAIETSYLGLFNTTNDGLSTNHILAVEVDTVQSPEFYDIDGNHVGIDVNGLVSNESATATYYSNEEGKNKSLVLMSGDPIQVWIDYDGAEKLLNVTLSPIRIAKPERPLLSTPLNLSEVFLDSMYVGFSAATGTITSDHYILGWSFNRSGQAQNLDFSKLPPVPAHGKASKKRGLLMIVLIVVAVPVFFIVLIVAAYIVWKKKYEEVCEDWEREYGPQRFPYKNLYKATKGFKDTEVIGKGGFGKVYRGVLPSNEQIAVKRVSHDSKQGMKEFVAEIVSMRRLRHRNLVQLRGYCRRKGEFILVYDYMPNGSLDKLLYSNTEPNLNWFQRFRIIRGIASGLLYLHEEWEQVVLHRDIKPGNVLLDAELNGRLGDFGLAKLYDHDSNPQTTNLVGTVGYLAPELIRTGKATTGTDVFAFGAFMLEVACGRRPVEQQGYGVVYLVEWVINCWKRGAIINASDPRLEGIYAEEQMELVLKLGLFCSHPNPAARPNMRQLMQYLDGDATLPDISPNSSSMDVFTNSNEASNSGMSFPSLFENSSAQTMSTCDSVFTEGR